MNSIRELAISLNKNKERIVVNLRDGAKTPTNNPDTTFEVCEAIYCTQDDIILLNVKRID